MELIEMGGRCTNERSPRGETTPETPRARREDRGLSASRSDRRWKNIALQSLGLLVLVNGVLALWAFRELFALRKETQLSLWRSEQQYQSLHSQIEFDSRRRQLLLGLRDEILRTRPGLGAAKAYDYALFAISAAEKYPSVDPLMLVAIGIVESGYDAQATSRAGARGLYQLHPTTGRLLARSLGWEYSDEMLYDPVRNTELATFYLEVLFSAYNDRQMVLAEYNGGPLNAGYLRAGVKKLAPETRAYVEKVSDVYARLRKELPVTVVDEPLEGEPPRVSAARSLGSGAEPEERAAGDSSTSKSLSALPELNYASPPLMGR